MIRICMIFILFFSVTSFGQSYDERLKKGEYLTDLAGCSECHSQSLNGPMVGGYELETPFGSFYTPNITPDRKTGIGTWSYKDFHRALRSGISPDGRVYYPSFPYRSYSKLTDEDIKNIYLYIMNQKPVEHQNKSAQLEFPFSIRWLNNFWQLFFFSGHKQDPIENIKVGVGPFQPAEDRSKPWNRGAYLVEAGFHCAECHSPRNKLGAPISDQWMSGSGVPIGDRPAPNITPSKDGLGDWSVEDWQKFLTSGFTPEGDSIGGEMALVIKNTSKLTNEDRRAVIEYLMSLTPIERGEP